MSFRLVKDPTNTEAQYFPITTTAFTVGTVLELDVGATAWTIANASTNAYQEKVVCIETSTNTDTEIKAVKVNTLQTWDVDTDSSSSASNNGDNMILSATAGKVTNTTNSTAKEACFVQTAPVGVTGDKRILGRFVSLLGLDPDAT